MKKCTNFDAVFAKQLLKSRSKTRRCLRSLNASVFFYLCFCLLQSSLNETVDALSMRIVQLENDLVEAQETQENLEAELKEHKNSLQDANDRNIRKFNTYYSIQS